MSVPIWLPRNTASVLPQILAEKVLLKNFYHHATFKMCIIPHKNIILCQNVCLPIHVCH